MTHQRAEASDDQAHPTAPEAMLPEKAWTARSEHTLRTGDKELLRVGDYLRARRLLEGPSPNRAWENRRRKARTRLARRNRGLRETA